MPSFGHTGKVTAARTADAKAEAWLEEYNQAKRTTYPPAI